MPSRLRAVNPEPKRDWDGLAVAWAIPPDLAYANHLPAGDGQKTGASAPKAHAIGHRSRRPHMTPVARSRPRPTRRGIPPRMTPRICR